MELDVRFALDQDLDYAGAFVQRAGQLLEGLEPPVRQAEEVGSLGCVDTPGRAKQGLELVARQHLGLGEEAEYPTPVVVDDDDPDRGGDVAQGGEAAHIVEQSEVAGDDRGRSAAGVGGADAG